VSGAREGTIDADPDNGRYRTESQKEWTEWAARGYSKPYQPRSVLRFGFVLAVLLAALLLTVFWLAAHGRMP
jgi:hypothetical protein